METWAVVFLGVIALALLVQAGFLVALSLAGMRLARRIDALQAQIDEQIAPTLRNLERVTRNASEVSDLATIQARRLDLVLSDTIDKVEETATLVQRLVVRPLRPVSHLVAVLKGIQAGIDVFLQLERKDRPPSPPRKGRGGSHEHEDDEHLFI